MTGDEATKPSEGMIQLQMLRQIHKLCGEMFDQIKRSGIIKPGRPLDDKLTYSLTASQNLRSIKHILEEIHHGLGHAYFDTCWSSTDIGSEDQESGASMAKAMVKQFLESLDDGNHPEITAKVIETEADIPSEAPEEVKAKLKELLTNAKRADNSKMN